MPREAESRLSAAEPAGGLRRNGDTERTQNIARLREANDDYLAKLEEWGVFLEPRLYDEFERCHIAAEAELKRVKGNNPNDKDKALNTKYFWSSYRQACQQIRDRIQSLAVLPGT